MSPFTLVVDGSTYAGSVAVLRGSEVVAEGALADVAKPGKGGREEQFLPLVADCLKRAGIAPGDLTRVICGSGPGSFTSLRIAASIAKGIAIGAGCPLFKVSSLALIISGNPHEPGMWIAVLPAMRGEVYAVPFELSATGFVTQVGTVTLLPEGEVNEDGAATGVRYSGPGVSHRSSPHARGAAVLLNAIIAGGPVDMNGWEPEYGRLAEAQVKWEVQHGRPLSAAG